ncbi:MAG: hypothetical protein LBO06_01985 [Bacteroidales bacterium]|jgi:hypothetical protein|nr:hypothetical protein [Bacteroidales bacterium]
MSWFQFNNRLKYNRKAKNEHSLHSPFMFETYLQCIKGRKDEDIIKELAKQFDVRELQNEDLCPPNERATIYYLKGIYQNEDSLKRWEELRKRTDISLDLNLYSLGLIVVRTGLKRQSYILKR